MFSMGSIKNGFWIGLFIGHFCGDLKGFHTKWEFCNSNRMRRQFLKKWGGLTPCLARASFLSPRLRNWPPKSASFGDGSLLLQSRAMQDFFLTLSCSLVMVLERQMGGEIEPWRQEGLRQMRWELSTPECWLAETFVAVASAFLID